jgi:hypothetical protein
MALIHEKLARIASQVRAVEKRSTNKDDKYSFRSIYHIYNELHPLFAREGVFLVPEVLDSTETFVDTFKGRASKQKVKVKWTFHCQDESCVVSTTLGEALDTSDKGVNKALTASIKYLLTYMFLIPTKPTEIDGDYETINVRDPVVTPKPEQPKGLLALLESKGLSRENLKEIVMVLGIAEDKELDAQDRKKVYEYVLKNY